MAATSKKAAKKVVDPALSDSSSTKSDKDVSVILETTKDRMVRSIQCSNLRSGAVATLNKKTKRYVQTIELTSDKPFSLETVSMPEGEYNGRIALMLQPEPTDREKFSFLQLPAEIRNMIYSLVLERPGYNIAIESKKNESFKPYWTQRQELYRLEAWSSLDYSSALMRVNKQIHNESTPYLFSRHAFMFGHSTVLLNFLSSIGPECVKLLTRVKVDRHYKTTAKRAYRLLSTATSLQKLRVYSQDNFSKAYGPPQSMLPPLLFPLIRAMCQQGRTRESALGIIDVEGGLKVHCSVHSSWIWYPTKVDDCSTSVKAYADCLEVLKEGLVKLLDEDEEKKSGKATTRKTRAGRNTKAVNYADATSESEDDDE